MLNLVELNDRFTIIQTDIDQAIPPAVFDCDFYSVTKTEDEISIIVNRKIDIPYARISDGWRGFNYIFVKESAFDKTIELFEKTGYINLK